MSALVKGCEPSNQCVIGPHTAAGLGLCPRCLLPTGGHNALCAACCAAATCLHVQDVLNLIVVHVLRVVPPPQLRPPVRLIVPAHKPLVGSAPAVLHLKACNAL